MGRIILGIVAGIFAALAAIMGIELIGHAIYPLPADAATGGSQDMAALIRNMPAGARAFVVGAWFGGALVGGIVAKLISRRYWSAWLIAGLVALAAIANIVMIPHPEWMQIGAVVAPLLGGLFAEHLAKPRRREPLANA